MKFKFTVELVIDDEEVNSEGEPWDTASVKNEIGAWLSDLGFNVQIKEEK